MSRRGVLGIVVASLVLHVSLLVHGLAWLPDPVRLAIALAVVVLVPGWAFVALGARPPGGAWLAAAWAFGLGVAWDAALVGLVAATGRSFLGLLGWLPLTSVLPWTVVLVRGRSAPDAGGPRLPRAAALAVLLAALLVAVHAARLGPVMGFSGDAPDHVGTLRRMLEGGRLFPDDAFFRDAGRLGADPRKGLWHGVVALLAATSGLDPLELWRWLSALVAPLLVLNAAMLGLLCAGATGAVLSAWLVPLVHGGGLAQSPIRHAAYASSLIDQLALAAVVAVLVDLRRHSVATRLAAVGLAFAAVATHVFAAVNLAVVLSALGVALWLRDRRLGAESRRLLGTSLGMAIVAAPYLVVRFLGAYATGNAIHTEPQGLTYLTDRLCVVSIGQLWSWTGPAWVLVPLAWPWLWTRGRHRTPVLFLLAASVAVALIAYDPWLVPLLQPRLGYMLMRTLGFVPFAVVIAWLLRECAATLRGPGPAARRLTAAALGLLALLLLAPAARDAVQVLADPTVATTAEPAESPARWRAEFAWMARHLDRGSVVLSDPATSYLVPMTTGLHVATLEDQHGSPNDTLALQRILDARDALDPFGTWARLREIVRRSGADVIVLNGRFARPPRLAYWAPSRPWFDAARARFDAHPCVFPRRHDAGDFVVYGIVRSALDTLTGPPPARPVIEPRRVVDVPSLAPPADGLPVPLTLALSAASVAPGESLGGVIRWCALRPAPAGSYSVVVRFDREPGVVSGPRWLGKPARKLLEAWRHERYRFVTQFVPAGDAYGVDLWRSDEVVRDSFALEVPRDVAAGSYRVEVRMLREPRYANLRLSDWFFDRDSHSGLSRGRLVVTRRRGGVGMRRVSRGPRRRRPAIATGSSRAASRPDGR